MFSFACTQYFVPAEPSREAFGDAVRDVFADDGARADKISNALQTAHAFSWPNITARFFALYDDLYYRLRRLAPPPAEFRRHWDAVEPVEAGIRS